MFGGGGYNGVLANGSGNIPAGPTDKPAPLARGNVTFASDSGHQANANGSRDGTFNRNDGALKNFAADAIKKTHHAAINIIQTRYAARVQKLASQAAQPAGVRRCLQCKTGRRTLTVRSCCNPRGMPLRLTCSLAAAHASWPSPTLSPTAPSARPVPRRTDCLR